MPKISVVTCNKKAENLISEQLKNIPDLYFYPDTIHMLKDKKSKDADLIIYDACNNKFAKEDISTLLEKEKGKKVFILTSKKYPLDRENFGDNIFSYLIPDEVAQFIKDLNKFVYPEKKLLDKEINKAVHNFENFKENNNGNCEVEKEQKEDKIKKEEKNSLQLPIEEEIKLKIADLTRQKISTTSIDISFSINRDKIEEIIINYIITDIMNDIRNNMDKITESIRDSIKEKMLLMIENELKEEIKNRTLETSNEIVSNILQNKLASMFNGNNH